MIKEILNAPLLVSLIVFMPLVIAFCLKKRKLLTIFVISYYFSFFTGLIVKQATAIPRPFINNPQVLGISTNIPLSYSFPSLHAMAGTIFAWALTSLLPKLSPVWFAIAMLISLSRVFLGLHYFQDIFFGFTLATIIFWLAFFILNKKELIAPNSNIKRKLIHFLFGLAIIFLFQNNLINIGHFFVFFLLFGIGIIISLLPPFHFLKSIIDHFERDKDQYFPAISVWYYLLSSLITLLIFPKNIALAGIANLAIGDSVNALVGHFYQLPDGQKTIGAAVCALIATVVVSLGFVSLTQALAAACVTSTLELIGPKIKGKRIDDNLWFPIAAGLAMILV